MVAAADSWLRGSGEMAERLRSHDWAATPLGPIERWSPVLRAAASLVLSSTQPAYLAWGPALIGIPNEAFGQILGESRHRRALGASASDTFHEAWPTLGHVFLRALGDDAIVSRERALHCLRRNGRLVEAHLSFVATPLRDAAGDRGVFVAATDATAEVVADRRARVLRRFRDLAGRARNSLDVLRRTCDVLAEDRADLAFVSIYGIDHEAALAHLVAASGLPFGGPARAETVDLRGCEPWPIGRLLHTRRTEPVEPLDPRLGRLCDGRWDERIPRARIVPIARPGFALDGAIVVGLGSRLDDAALLEQFVEGVAGNVAELLTRFRAPADEEGRERAVAELDRALASAEARAEEARVEGQRLRGLLHSRTLER